MMDGLEAPCPQLIVSGAPFGFASIDSFSQYSNLRKSHTCGNSAASSTRISVLSATTALQRVQTEAVFPSSDGRRRNAALPLMSIAALFGGMGYSIAPKVRPTTLQITQHCFLFSELRKVTGLRTRMVATFSATSTKRTVTSITYCSREAKVRQREE